MSESLLEFDGIGKSFSGTPVLREVSFSLRRGEVLGLVGENGAGKSTLMDILGGNLRADAGRMRLEGAEYAPRDPGEATRRGVAFIHQELNLFPNLSIAENLFIAAFPKRRVLGLGIVDRRALAAGTRALLAAVDLRLPPETLVERLSPGERQLLEIARALSAEARIIIFDEPTTSLTSPETERLFAMVERFRQSGISMVYISHVLGDVLRLCDRIVVLRDGEVVGSGARSELSSERMIALMVGRSIDQLYPRRAAEPSGEAALRVEGLCQQGTVEGIGFSVRRGEVLGVFGLMGSGRTELARLLFGLEKPSGGEVYLGGGALGRSSPRERIRRGMAFLTEDRREEGILMEATVAENIALVSLPSFARRPLGRIDRRGLARAVAGAASWMGVRAGSIDRQAARSLSGGNQQKTVLARWIVGRPSVFILDEPTRGIDVGAKQEVYRAINELSAGGTAALLISSEIEELMGMCDRILVMRAGRIEGAVERRDFDRERILRSALEGGPP